MDNHKQEVIDGFVKALMPVYLKDALDDDVFGNVYHHIDDAYELAEALFERHRKTCKICEENKEAVLEIF